MPPPPLPATHDWLARRVYAPCPRVIGRHLGQWQSALAIYQNIKSQLRPLLPSPRLARLARPPSPPCGVYAPSPRASGRYLGRSGRVLRRERSAAHLVEHSKPSKFETGLSFNAVYVASTHIYTTLLRPTEITYNNLIISCGRGGQWQVAAGLFGQMQRAGIKPSVRPQPPLITV
eukprot:1186892-Prorocentrum_minimum.AAC.2